MCFVRFHRDIWPCLQDVGYDGVLLTGSHEAKWAEKGDPPGDRVTVATFWLRDAFSLDDEVHRHRTLGLVLRCLRQGKDSQVEAVGGASVSTTTSTDTSGCDGDVEAPYDGELPMDVMYLLQLQVTVLVVMAAVVERPILFTRVFKRLNTSDNCHNARLYKVQ